MMVLRYTLLHKVSFISFKTAINGPLPRNVTNTNQCKKGLLIKNPRELLLGVLLSFLNTLSLRQFLKDQGRVRHKFMDFQQTQTHSNQE